MGGVFNIIIGLIMVAAGLSGKFALIGTNNSTPLVAVGIAIAAWGIFRIYRDRKNK